MQKILLNNEYPIILPDHRANRYEYLHEPYWEKPRLDSIHTNIKEGDVVYYIGTELGEMAALCQIWGAEVVLFEPNHSAWPVIKAIWKANELKNPLGIYAGFASNTHSPVPVKPDLELHNGKGYELGEDGWPHYADEEIVLAHGFSELYQEYGGLPEYKIDSLVEEGLKPPTALMIDVEGADWVVLRGAEEVIKKYKPKIWMSWHAEFMFHQYGTYLRDARNWLIDKGYEEIYLEFAHELHEFYKPL